MIKDDTKAQIPLFELPVREKKVEERVEEKPAPKKKREATKTADKPTRQKPASKKAPQLPAGTRAKAKPVSGLVPEGDVRLTANIRQDLHLKLKIEAAHRRTTIGDLIEELVEKYL